MMSGGGANVRVSFRSLVAAFLVAFTLTITSFLVTAMVVRHRALVIGTAAEGIARNAAPSIESLSAMRSILRTMEVDLDDAVDRSLDSGGSLTVPAEVWEDDTGLRTAWLAYRALPRFPGEAERQAEIEEVLVRTQAELNDLAHALQTQDGPRAIHLFNSRVKPDFDILDERLSAAVQLNAARSSELAGTIVNTRNRVTSTALGLDAMCVLLSLLSAAFAVRLAREYARAMEERVSELDVFASRVAHDIKGPVSGVALALDVALHPARSPERAREVLERARGSLQRVGKLVDELLLVARRTALSPGDLPASVPEALQHVVEECRPLALEHQVELELDAAEPATVGCSEAVLYNMVANLVSNAIKHMADRTIRRVQIRSRVGHSSVRIEVEDTGPGIPQQLLEAIFRPYVRATRQDVPGLGLGLATVRQLVTTLGGKSGVESELGKGSLFWIQLPRVTARTESLGPAASHARGAFPWLTRLLRRPLTSSGPESARLPPEA
jgi:signal transduction histidine kinase